MIAAKRFFLGMRDDMAVKMLVFGKDSTANMTLTLAAQSITSAGTSSSRRLWAGVTGERSSLVFRSSCPAHGFVKGSTRVSRASDWGCAMQLKLWTRYNWKALRGSPGRKCRCGEAFPSIMWGANQSPQIDGIFSSALGFGSSYPAGPASADRCWGVICNLLVGWYSK